MTKSIATVLETRPLNPRNKDREEILDPRIPRKTQAETDRVAQYLVDKFQSPQHHDFFCKAAWALNDAAIHSLVEKSFAVARIPRAYFIKSVQSHPSYIKRYAQRA